MTVSLGATDRTGARTLGLPATWLGFFRGFFRLTGPFWRDWTTRGVTAALIALTAAQVVVQVALNLWIERLFDAFSTRSMSGFVTLAGAFVLILVSDIAVMTTHLRVRRRLQIAWRQWLTQRLTDDWMAAGRHYRMSYMPGDHDNPDGRLAEDARIATESAIDLGHSLLYSIMLLASFIHILWSLSGSQVLTLGEFEIPIEGHLVWVALIYSLIGISVALSLGPRLVDTAEERQTYEANFRFGLAHAREHSAAIALIHGEMGERRQFGRLLADVATAWNWQTMALFRFMFFTSVWTVLSPIFPILIAAPRFIAGAITLGVLMQIAQAFQQVVAALSWPVDNLQHVALWRASGERILGLHQGLTEARQDDARRPESRITITTGERPILAFDDVTIRDPEGNAAAANLTFTISSGDRVWMDGEPAALMAIAKAAAGLWTSGSGAIELPSDGPIFFMPQRPYLPRGSLADVVSYPAPAAPGQEERIRLVLGQAGIAHLMPRLESSEKWEEILSDDEQQRLGFARLLFHRPRWMILQHPADALNGDGAREIMDLVQREFTSATIIVADGHPPSAAWRHLVLGTVAAPARSIAVV